MASSMLAAAVKSSKVQYATTVPTLIKIATTSKR